MRPHIFILFLAFVLTSFFQRSPQKEEPSPWKPRPCQDPCSTCRIDSMGREVRWGRAKSAQYESFKNKELARIKAQCDTLPPPDERGCPPRTLAFRETNGEWNFWEEHRNGDVNNCKKIADADRLRFKVPAPEKALEKRRPFLFLTTVSEETVLPFEDKYPDWQGRQFDIEMPDTCASIDCFKCEQEHKGQKLFARDTNVCDNLKSFLKKLARIKNATHKFSAIVPGTSNVWLIRQDNTVKKVAAIEPKWFTKDFMKSQFGTEKSQPWMSSLRNLAQLAAYDPNISISAKNIEAFKFIARVRVEGQSYELGVHPGGYYFPIEQGNLSKELIRKLITTMTTGRKNQTLWRKKLMEWLNGQNESRIVDFIPNSWSRTEYPMDVVCRQTTEDGLNQALVDALNKSEDLDILVRTHEGTHQIWRSGGTAPETSPILENMFQSRNRFHRMLALADPNLKILAENSGEAKLVFIYKNNPNRVWSWVGPTNTVTVLKSFALLKGENTMSYSDQLTRPYIARLMKSVSESEKAFLLRFAENPMQFQLIDWYPYSDDVHVVLYKVHGDESPDNDAQKIHRLSSQNGPPLPPMLFKIVNTSWADIASCYTDWKRTVLAESIFLSAEAEEVEVWLSPKGLGFSRKDGTLLLDVYPDDRCSFKRRPLSKIENFINEAIYKGGVLPSKNSLFKDWLSNIWDKRNWRANPRGLLARVQGV